MYHAHSSTRSILITTTSRKKSTALMASEPITRAPEDLHCLEIQSFARGYHAYMDIWTPVVGQTLLLRREPTNPKDKNAVALYEDDSVVGHVPYNLAPYLSRFLARDVNKAFAEVTGEKVNRGAGYGLEIPCVYRLYGPKIYVDKMKQIKDTMTSSGLL